MADKVDKFSFQDYRLLSVHFDLNRNFEPGPDIQVNSTLSLTHDYIDDQNSLRLFMKVEVSGEAAPLNISVEMGSLFQFEKKPAADKLSKIAEINCAAMVFPFIREVIADLTRRSGLPPFLIPPFNFIELHKSNHEGE
jgi:preprotein translocase subunit SecB